MSFVRPSQYPDWVGTQVEPTSPQKITGFLPNFRPPSEWHNFLFGIMSDWVRWLDQQEQANAAQFDYDATIGAGGTFADFNSLMAAGNISQLKKILILSPLTLTATQVINQADMLFIFKPQAVISKGLTTTPGFSIQADRVTFLGGRFTDFNGGSDVAIQIETTRKNNAIIGGARFANCTTAVNDLGQNSLLQIIEEV